MNAGTLTLLKFAISFLSCGVFIWVMWTPSPSVVREALVPLFLFCLSFCVLPGSREKRVAVIGAVCAALGYLLLNEPTGEMAFLPYAAIVSATAPFFYVLLNACCGTARAALEQKLHGVTDSSRFFYLCLFAAVASLAAQLVFSLSPNIWVDEAFSVALASHPWREMLSIASTDVHPPLYYIILKALTEIVLLVFPHASAICIGKLVSVLPFALLLVAACTKVRRTWGNYVGGLWGMAIFAAPSLILQGVEIRMYGWAMFFVTLAYLFAYDVITKARKRDWCCFVLAGLASAYTHYYACIAVTPVYLLLLYISFRKGRFYLLRWLAAAAVTVVGYLPWLFIFVTQARNVEADYWIQYPDLTEFRRYVVGVFGDSVTAGIVCLIIFLQFLSIGRGKEGIMHRRFLLTGILCGVATIFVGLTATYLIRPVFAFRYMYPGLACFWLALIIGAEKTGKAPMKLFFAVLMASAWLYQFLAFGLLEGKQAKELIRWTELLNRYPDAVLITDNNAEQRTFSTLTRRTCLTFDKEATTEISKQVYPACRQPNIADIQSFLNQEKHPTYIVILTGPSYGNDKIALPCQYYVDKFFWSFYFDMYIIPATENGAEH